MNNRKLAASSFLVVAAAGLIAYPALAALGVIGAPNTAADGRKIAAQLDKSKTTLARAVTAAEEHSKGRAISVISDVTEGGAVAVHVYCIAGDPPQIMKCSFDHASGTVKGMKKVEEFPITPAPANATGPAGAAPKAIEGQTLEVACGSCLYKMPGVDGCHLATMIDGKPYLVEGAKWPNHDFCDRKLQAVVTGKLEGDPAKFVAAKLEPKP